MEKIAAILESLLEKLCLGHEKESKKMTKEINEIALEFHKTLVEVALNGEMSYHLGYLPSGKKLEEKENSRNGYNPKIIREKSPGGRYCANQKINAFTKKLV